jgi:acyl-[acyl-carrier-protein]-phospholipid O-acyltransferase/long-chain-fatty-acid--[acyl-carrier-protein] ligase
MSLARWIVLLPKGDLLVRFFLWLVTHTLYSFRVRGAGNVPQRGGALLVSNHVSFADAFLISASLKRPVRHLMWRGYMKTHGFQRVTRLMKVIPIAGTDSPRQLLLALRAARRAVQEGDLVCLFAEGAISRTGNLLRFHRGLEKIMRGLDSPIIPVAIDRMWGGITRFAGGKLSWRLPLVIPQPVTVIFGRPLEPDASAFRVRRAVQELQAEAFQLRRRPGESLPAKFIETAKKRPFTFAMADHTGRELSFRRALAAVLALSKALGREIGPRPNVGLCLPPSTGAALANVALNLMGRVPVNLNYTAGPELAGRCARKAGLDRVITSRTFLEKMGWPPGPEMLFLEELVRKIGALERVKSYLAAQILPAGVLKRLYLKATDPDAPAAILFSSGTTGEPKGVVLSHFNILSNIQSLDQVFELSRSDRVVGVLPFFHSFGLTTSVWLPLIVGFGALYHPNPLDGHGVARLVRERRGTLFMSPPSFFQLYIRQCSLEDFKSLRYAVSGAEKLKPEVAREFEKKFKLPLLEGYGCTELSPVAAVNVFSPEDERRADWKPGSIGRAIPGVAVKVVDPETHEELPEDTEGLLLVKGPNVMLGYLDEEELTAESIRDGWYVTGDIARLDKEGFVEITDRLARFSKIAGEMVPHGKVEELLAAAAPGVEFGVTALPDPRKGERLVVIHTPLPAGQTPAALCERIRGQHIPNLWIPRPEAFIQTEGLPKTGTGKLDLHSLREMARERLGGPVLRR